MGVEYSAALVFGLPSSELPEMEYENVGLNRVAPYFDAVLEDCILGIFVSCSDDYSAKEIDLNKSILAACEAKDRFFAITGKQGKLFLSVCSY